MKTAFIGVRVGISREGGREARCVPCLRAVGEEAKLGKFEPRVGGKVGDGGKGEQFWGLRGNGFEKVGRRRMVWVRKRTVGLMSIKMGTADERDCATRREQPPSDTLQSAKQREGKSSYQTSRPKQGTEARKRFFGKAPLRESAFEGKPL